VSPTLPLEIAFLLFFSQGLLGSLAYLARGLPLVGIPLTIIQIWAIVRIAFVLREEVAIAKRKGVDRNLRGIAVVAALVWQLPVLIGAPFWAPHWATLLWQGTLLPPLRALGIDLPVQWLWVAFILQILLFVAATSWAEPARYMPKATTLPPTTPTGNWAIARSAPEGSRRAPTTKEVAAAQDDPS